MRNDMIDFGDRWVSVSQAAAIAEVSKQAVHQWIAKGWLQPLQTDDVLLLEVRALREFLTRRQTASAAGIKVATLSRWVDEDDPPMG